MEKEFSNHNMFEENELNLEEEIEEKEKEEEKVEWTEIYDSNKDTETKHYYLGIGFKEDFILETKTNNLKSDDIVKKKVCFELQTDCTGFYESEKEITIISFDITDQEEFNIFIAMNTKVKLKIMVHKEKEIDINLNEEDEIEEGIIVLKKEEQKHILKYNINDNDQNTTECLEIKKNNECSKIFLLIIFSEGVITLV